ncbi:MAG TPA: recombination protein RecR [Elusimicrobia bacterium]|nr:recombination protein RecR [Elusimicrobiota bacterium]HBT62307.1 recombination protein RecR [Elusimicrobiota bacterium]
MKSWDRLVASLKRLPGVGPRQAERLGLYLLRASDEEVETLLSAVRDVKSSVRPCRRCFDFTELEICRICSDPGRDQGLLCVVEEPQDVAAIERSRGYKGLYHVLHGAIAPLDGIGPDSLRIRELLERMTAESGMISEVILATDPDAEGDATALYIAQLLKSRATVKISRIAHGVPLGGDLDYIDERTLSHALAGRREF